MKRYSRNQFVRRSAVAVGGVASLGALNPASAFARSAGDPRPIPGGFDEAFNPVPSDPFIHVLPPGIGFEMSTITDFNGVVGASEILGVAHGSDGSSYNFDTDMRFMQGAYIDVDGRLQNASFGFIWIDLFDTGAVGDPQVHDFEPGIKRSGLFWTIPISHGAIDVDPGSGRARLHAEGIPVLDFGDFVNSVSGGPSTPSVVSFDVRWSGNGERRKIRDEVFGFVGEYVSGPATISFSAAHAATGAVLYESDPVGQNNDGPSGMPAVGRERNGVFFH